MLARTSFGALLFTALLARRPAPHRDQGAQRTFPTPPTNASSGRAYFSVDPALAANRAVVDLDKAPRNAAGQVEFSERSLHAAAQIAGGRQRDRALRSLQSRRQGHAQHVQPRRLSFSSTAATRWSWLGWQFDVPEQPEPAPPVRADRQGRHRRGARRDRGRSPRASRTRWPTAITGRTRSCGPTIPRSR